MGVLVRCCRIPEAGCNTVRMYVRSGSVSRECRLHRFRHGHRAGLEGQPCMHTAGRNVLEGKARWPGARRCAAVDLEQNAHRAVHCCPPVVCASLRQASHARALSGPQHLPCSPVALPRCDGSYATEHCAALHLLEGSCFLATDKVSSLSSAAAADPKEGAWRSGPAPALVLPETAILRRSQPLPGLRARNISTATRAAAAGAAGSQGHMCHSMLVGSRLRKCVAMAYHGLHGLPAGHGDAAFFATPRRRCNLLCDNPRCKRARQSGSHSPRPPTRLPTITPTGVVDDGLGGGAPGNIGQALLIS